MREVLRDVQKQLENKIDGILQEAIYELHRYEKKCTLALLFSHDMINTELIKELARQSDIVIPIDDNAAFIIFTYTPEEGGLKAAEKILMGLNPNFKTDIYGGVVECTPESSGSILVRNLFNIVEFAIDNGHENEILDISYLQGVY